MILGGIAITFTNGAPLEAYQMVLIQIGTVFGNILMHRTKIHALLTEIAARENFVL